MVASIWPPRKWMPAQEAQAKQVGEHGEAGLFRDTRNLLASFYQSIRVCSPVAHTSHWSSLSYAEGKD
jgi:hypothetical protein